MKPSSVIWGLAKGGAEQEAIEAGEIDAIIDHASSNVILLPLARRALHEHAAATSVLDREGKETSDANALLAALPDKTYEALKSGLEKIELHFGEALYEPGQPIRDVYFPSDCLVSLLTLVDDRSALEIGMVGREGMVGVPLMLGSTVSPARAVVRGAGLALRMSATRFGSEFARSLPLQHELYRYLDALLAQISQTAVCNRFHSVEERLARWLLMTYDRVQSQQLLITHASMAYLLGVRRVSITEAGCALQRRKLISYSRGRSCRCAGTCRTYCNGASSSVTAAGVSEYSIAAGSKQPAVAATERPTECRMGCAARIQEPLTGKLRRLSASW